MAKKKNPPGKETSKRVASAAGRLQAKLKHGTFWFRFVDEEGLVTYTEVTSDVSAVSGTALVQKISKPKGQGRKARKRVNARPWRKLRQK